jgi:hypothetical protein
VLYPSDQEVAIDSVRGETRRARGSKLGGWWWASWAGLGVGAGWSLLALVSARGWVGMANFVLGLVIFVVTLVVGLVVVLVVKLLR